MQHNNNNNGSNGTGTIVIAKGYSAPVTPVNAPVTPAQTPTTGNATTQALQAQQAKLQAQIVALQQQQAAIVQLSAGVQSGQYYVVKPSNAQTNVGIQDLPKFVTLLLQALPLVQGSNALLPAQQQAITQLVLQAAHNVELQGNVPLAKCRIAQA